MHNLDFVFNNCSTYLVSMIAISKTKETGKKMVRAIKIDTTF